MSDQDTKNGNDAPADDLSDVDEESVTADVVRLPGIEDVEVASDLDDFTSREYTSATTQEYQGLAEDVSRAAEEEWEQQAVAATLPGVGSGLVGFEDVSGTTSHSEESYEAVEQAATSDLTMRIGSAVGIFGMFAASLFLGGWWFSGFVLLVMVVAVGEFYSTLRTRDYRPLALFGLIGVALIGVGAHVSGPTAVGGWAALATAAVVLFFSLTPRRDPMTNAAVTIMGMVWVGLLSFAISIARGPEPVVLILFVVLVVAVNDVGAYFAGRSIGKRKLAPVLSPKKTVEGLVGGFIFGAVAASVMAVVPPWLDKISLSQALITAGIVGVFAPLGDLAESMVKRSIGVKDMGSVLPGHGGMLDRIDGFLFAVPAVYLLFRGFGLL